MRSYLANDQFPPLKNDLLLRAARGEEPTERAPVWIMRQAGRYLPGRVQRSQKIHGFFEICRTPELATEITLQPIRRYSGLLDASIIFSDILVIPQAMGLVVEMHDGGGPFFPQPLVAPDDLDLKRLRENVDVDQELGYVFDAITMTRKGLKGEVPLIGFCGAPWTLMCYMVGSSKSLPSTKQWIFKYPEESKKLLEKITKVCVDFLVGQVKAGAQLLQVFDSNAGDLSPHDFATFSLPYLKVIAESVRHNLEPQPAHPDPSDDIIRQRCRTRPTGSDQGGYDVLGLDWVTSPESAIAATGGQSRKVGLQGNIDPAILYGGREAIEREVKPMVEKRHHTHPKSALELDLHRNLETALYNPLAISADLPRPTIFLNSALGSSLIIKIIKIIGKMSFDCSAPFIAYSLLSTFSTITENERDATQVIIELLPCYDVLTGELHVTHEAHIVACVFLEEFRAMARRHCYIQEGSLDNVVCDYSSPRPPSVPKRVQRHPSYYRRCGRATLPPTPVLNELLNKWRLRNFEIVSEWHSYPVEGVEEYRFGLELPNGAQLEEVLMPLPYPTKQQSTTRAILPKTRVLNPDMNADANAIHIRMTRNPANHDRYPAQKAQGNSLLNQERSPSQNASSCLDSPAPVPPRIPLTTRVIIPTRPALSMVNIGGIQTLLSVEMRWNAYARQETYVSYMPRDTRGILRPVLGFLIGRDLLISLKLQ
ncbi:uroporphyrinogen decarboxylase [Rhizoctonia solani]|uniref:Uroporphyrinogen decarboxylase n=1 Tax=Rhizoctonia solani TaxID=456999 RepID=A0A8H8SS92_9AGAM|nr:uroporphyrinogen decarboxylase [Rhizoctonia solani]QRW15749.1 uroporphyrinogen decarboxylase [Rhizoctonia solani]